MNTTRFLRTSLVRKLAILDDLNNNQIGATGSTRPVHRESLTFRFLEGYPKLVGMVRRGALAVSSDVEVRVLADAIEYAYLDGSEAGLTYIEYFDGVEGVNVELLRQILDEAEEYSADELKKINRIDQSLFKVSEMVNDPTAVKECYKRAFARHEIELPFAKESMNKLLSLVGFPGKRREISRLEDLRIFSFEFFTALWPLFGPRVLSIIFSYFQYRSEILPKKMEADWNVLTMFGFEKLLSRLILLRAVNGDQESREFFEQKKVTFAASFSSDLLNGAQNFLSGKPSGLSAMELLSDGNPIENAILLSIHVMERTDEINFVTRLIEAYNQDPSISLVLNWDAVYEDITNLKYLQKPELIFLSSLITQPSVMSSSKRMSGQYGHGGAGADLRRVARYHRDKLSGTRSSFLSSFDALPKSAAELVVHFLFSGGMLDRIANEFPSNTSTAASLVPSSPAVRSLEARDDLINYARKRRIFSDSYAKFLLEDVRDKYRQIRFESSEDSGRIRIRQSELAGEIYSWLKPRINVVALPKNRSSAEYFERRLNARSSLLAPEITNFLCFSSKNRHSKNRFAFNNLLADKLRHNFLSIRISEKLNPIFDEYQIGTENAHEILECVESHIKEFSRIWLTIDRERSFFEELSEKLSEIIVQDSIALQSPDEVATSMARNVAAESIARFDALLGSCRKAWKTEFLEGVKAEVRDTAEELNFSELIADRLVEGLEQGFDESSRWMRVNQDERPNTVRLRDLVLSETFLLKKQPTFREKFKVDLFLHTERGGRQSTDKELVIGGEFLTPIVAIVDNLIPNATKSSFLGNSTSIRVRCVYENATLRLDIANKIDASKSQEVLRSVRRAQELIKEPIQNEVLGTSGGGTGIFRIRRTCEDEFGSAFEMRISADLSDEYPVVVTCRMPCPNARWE
ncbi:MAG: hypothetical protein JJU08_19290 [Rhodobacteraceae bacterium]|nr:hypothetical protein [Paracoccaceae bacterium]